VRYRSGNENPQNTKNNERKNHWELLKFSNFTTRIRTSMVDKTATTINNTGSSCNCNCWDLKPLLIAEKHKCKKSTIL